LIFLVASFPLPFPPTYTRSSSSPPFVLHARPSHPPRLHINLRGGNPPVLKSKMAQATGQPVHRQRYITCPVNKSLLSYKVRNNNAAFYGEEKMNFAILKASRWILIFLIQSVKRHPVCIY
jgi:hypothetical protein